MKMSHEKQQGESDGLICEEIPEAEPISNGSWSEHQQPQTSLINACCAPLFSVGCSKFSE